MIGKKIAFKGETLYSPGYYDDGLAFGTVFKDEDAFKKRPDDVCYIPEHAFDDMEAVMKVGDDDFYRVDGYTRKDLELLIQDEVDWDGDPIDIEYFFFSLIWCYPETRLIEMTY